MRKSTAFILGFAVVLVAGTASAKLVDLVTDPPASASAGLAAPDPATTGTTATTVATTTTTKADGPAPVASKSVAVEEEAEPTSSATEKPVTGTVEKEPAPAIDETPPVLVVHHPSQGATVPAEVVFEGETEPGVRVFVGAREAEVAPGGAWRGVIRLDPGARFVKVAAKDAAGNVTAITVKVVVEGAVDVGFTVNQKYGEHTEPYEKLWGTAAPGTKVLASSAYGSGEAKADDTGQWRLPLHLSAPSGVPVEITVSNGGVSKVVTFVWKAVDVGFTADRKYGEHTEPFEKYFGTATPGTRVWATSPYGSGETKADEAGRWFLGVHFDAPAAVPFEVAVTDGTHTNVFGFVWSPGEVGFSANQKYGSCSEDPPYDVFWGTATPGSTVTVSSPYGSGSTVAGDFGKWDLRVEFPDAPVGQAFEVVVRDGTGGEKVFVFLRTTA